MDKVALTYWIRKWELDDNLIYKKASERQAQFVEHKICGNLLKACGFVISKHMSKSCILPVYYIKARNGIRLTMRCNFYDWKVSVEIPDGYDNLPANYLPMDCMSHSMVEHSGEKIPSCYCEGFKKEWCFDAYNPQQPNKKFTIEIPDEERLYVVLHRLKHAYPEKVFKVEDDKRTVGKIRADIDKLLDANGFNEMRDEIFFEKSVKRRVIGAWNILWRTYCKMGDLYHDGKMPSEDYPSVSDDSREYAECIIKYPEVHEAWLMEEWMYKEG